MRYSVSLIVRYSAVAVLTFALTACSGSYQRLCKEEIIMSFPETIALENTEAIPLDLPGLIDIKHYGNRLYCLTLNPNGMLVSIDRDSFHMLGTFLKMGNGPLEILAPIPFRQMFFDETEGELMVSLFNMRDRVIRLNLTRSESEGITVGDSSRDVPKDLQGKGSLYLLDNDTYLFQYPEDQRRVLRGIWKDGSVRYSKAQEILNSYSLKKPDSFLFNIFYTIAQFEPSKKRFVEASTMQNSIHLYDEDGPFLKTLSIGGPLKDYSSIEEAGNEGLSKGCIGVETFENFFVVLYSGAPLFSQTSKLPVLQFYDWEGSPLLEIELPCKVTSFDLDMDTKTLFLADQNSEKLYVFDISELNLIE
jgi:hypothetical protein